LFPKVEKGTAINCWSESRKSYMVPSRLTVYSGAYVTIARIIQRRGDRG